MWVVRKHVGEATMRQTLFFSVIFLMVLFGSNAYGQGCGMCHGSGKDPLPPMDTLGNSSTDAVGVGAHQAHAGPSSWHAEIACTECHVVPADDGDPGHNDTDLPAELVWGPLAEADGATPSWNGTTCNVYCHGATLPDAGTDPPWTVVDGTYSLCEACHGLPPAAPHPDETDCSACHPGIDAAQMITDPASHIDGIVQVDTTAVSGAHDGPPTARAALLDAAPNPFNPSTWLIFDLARPGHARLQIFDTGGRLVATLVDGPRAAGRHTLMWDGRDGSGMLAASGLYLYRLETDGFSEAKRMTLVK